LFLFVFYIYKHIQFNTISCKQKGKSVKPQVLKCIYGAKVCLKCMYIYMWILAYNRNDRFNKIKYTLFHKRVKMFFNMCRLLMLFKLKI